VTDPLPISVETLAAAETLFGISHTDAERQLMLDNLAEQIELAQQRRAIALPTALSPATRFDPRLPGFAAPPVGPFRLAPDEAKLPEHDEDIAFAPVSALSAWIRTGQLTATRLTKIYLDRIARLNPELFCFSVVTAEAASRRAAELDALTAQGKNLGPLHGIPYGMKDIIDTAGVETSWGAEPYQGRVPEEDAFVTTLLFEAGAIMLGKTSVGALAYGDLWYGGRTRNPWNTQEGSSGSSAGSASATAAGLVGFAIGTETLGSIVSPSTRCGTTGLRPTHGRVSRRGAMPLCWSLDKIGPICRTVEDTAIILQVLNQPDPLDAFQIPAPFGYESDASIARLRVGYYMEDFEHAEAHALDQQALETVRSLGLELVPLERRPLPYDALLGILFAEAAASFEELTLSGQDDALTWQDSDAWPNSFRKARFLSAVDHVQLDRLRRLVMTEMDAVFRQVDVVIGPSLVGPMLVITNYTGHPCLCLPAGFFSTETRRPVSLSNNPPEAEPPMDATPSEVPHSVCLWGPLFNEGPMLALGRALERKFGALRRPPLARLLP
jgi:Asp-tRNA(Asn)/Glu-tRNA(Gln) amidotransferase A subunit family amidase